MIAWQAHEILRGRDDVRTYELLAAVAERIYRAAEDPEQFPTVTPPNASVTNHAA